MPSRLQPLGKDQKNKILNSLFIQGGKKEKIKVENGLQAQFAREPSTSTVVVYEVYLMSIRMAKMAH